MKLAFHLKSLFTPKRELESVQDWRQYLLDTILGSLVIFGTAVAIPSIVILLKQGLWPAAVADVVLLAIGTLLWRRRTASFKVRSWGLCAILYLLGFTLLFMMGPTSQIYLMTAPAIGAILLGPLPSAFMVIGSAITLFWVGYLGFADFQIPGLAISPMAQWFTITINFLFVNSVITLSISLLLQGLEKSFAKATEASRAKSEFLANMSHEIRTPMNAILGMLQLTQSTQLTPQQADYIVKCDGAAKTLLRLINDVLDFSKIEADKLIIDKHTFRLEELMRDLSVVLSANSHKKSLEILLEADPDIPDLLMGDSLRILQVLTNLGTNAVKFTPTGQVVITLKKVLPVDGSGHSVRIEFSVTDTGIGIAPDYLNRIFDGFAQAEASTTRKYGGTGLGLVISQRLVAAMGGTLSVTSELGHGSCFSFTLNLATAAKQWPDHALGADSAPTAFRVLVVDDHPVAAELTRRMSQRWSAASDVAHSGLEALDLIGLQHRTGVQPYDVVFVDCQMTPMDGWETARAIREVCAQQSSPQPTLIMVTADSSASLSDDPDPGNPLFGGLIIKPATSSVLRDTFLDARQAMSGVRQTKAKPTANPTQNLAGMRILVVEDNHINQQVAQELLASQGAQVDLADNGLLGVQAVVAANPPYHAVLMDVQMPVMDGYAATRAIRQMTGFAKLPIIGLTANALVSDRNACLESGMTEHVGKPFDLLALASLLVRLTGHAPPGPTHDEAPSVVPVHALKTSDIDLAPALQRLGNLNSLYISAARKYLETLPQLPSQLSQQLETGEWAPMGALAHSSKSTAATLGLFQLASELGRLEKLCNSGAAGGDVRTAVAAFAELARGGETALRDAVALLEPTATAAPKLLQPDLIAPVMLRLIALLEADDLTALEVFSESREAIDTAPDALLAGLEAAMQELDLGAALVVCRDLQALCTNA